MALAALQLPMVAPSLAQPALWLISRGPARLYLFATVDSVPPGVVWTSDKLTKAFEDSEDIWFEHPLLTPSAMYSEIEKIGASNTVPATHALLDVDQDEQMQSLVRATSLPQNTVDALPPWAVATLIQTDFIVRSGLGPDAIDRAIYGWTQRRSKQVHYLNQVDYLWTGLAEQSSEYQLLMLFEAAEARPNFARQEQSAFDAWISGDLGLMIGAARKSLNWNLPLYQQIVLDQNTRYADYIRRLLDNEGTHFICLGYKQVVGTGGVLRLLQEDGLLIDRLQ